MHSLIQFFLRFGHVVLFLLMEAFAFVLLVQGNDFQHSVVFTSANRVSGQLYTWRHQTSSYFNLREKNQVLWQQNSDLQKRVAALEATLQAYQIQEQALKPALDFEYIHARVIKNSVSMMSNYFTLDVGKEDGVEKGMGVVSPDGVVGIVKACSPHYSVVLSVLNVQARISCKVQHSDVVGSLTWEGGDTHKALMMELPNYQMWAAGDTIVTADSLQPSRKDCPSEPLFAPSRNQLKVSIGQKWLCSRVSKHSTMCVCCVRYIKKNSNCWRRRLYNEKYFIETFALVGLPALCAGNGFAACAFLVADAFHLSLFCDCLAGQLVGI